MFRFHIVGSIMDPPCARNADWIEGNDDCVLWMDGATPFGISLVPGYPNDASWFVRRFAQIFLGLPRERSRISDLVEETQRRILGEYERFAETAAALSEEKPFACFGAARVIANTVELTNAGDCILLYEIPGRDVGTFGYCTVGKLDDRALELLQKTKTARITHGEALAQMIPHIKRNRSLRNSQFGYEVVEPSDRKVELERMLLPAVAESRFLAMSDGMYRAVSTYNLTSLNELFETAFTDGLSPLVDRIRAVEREDPQACAFPRLKLQDDISAIAFRVEKH